MCAGRNIEAREGVFDLFELDVAALRDLPGAIDGVLEFAEELHHFVARLEVEIGMIPVHAVRVRHRLARLDAHENFVRAGVFAAQVVGVVGGDERNARIHGKAVDLRSQPLVLLEAVILNFEEEVLFAEDVAIGVGEAARVFVFVGEDGFVEVAAQARREADEAFRMGGQQIFIDARLVVKAFEKRRGNQLDEVLVAFLVFAEQDEVVVAVGVGPGLVALLRDVDFAADDGLDSLRFGGVVEADRAEEIAVIGHRDGGHFLLGDDVHQLVDFAGAVEKRVVGVVVKVNEWSLGHGRAVRNRLGETILF